MSLPFVHRRWIVLAVASAANFMTILDLWAVTIAYPALQSDFAPGSLSDVSWVLNVYAIVVAAMLIAAGRLADGWGRRRSFLVGLIVFGLASVGCAAAPFLPALIAFRAIQALGAAVLMPTSLSLALSAFGERNKGIAVGVWAAVGAVAASGGPILGGLLILLSWRWIFLINVPIVVAVAIIAGMALPRDEGVPRRRPDLLGAALLFAIIALVCVTLVQLSGWSPWLVAAAIGVVAGLLGLTVVHVLRHPDPIVSPGLFSVGRFRVGAIAIFSYYAGFAAILLGSTLVMTEGWHFSPLRTAVALVPGPLLSSAVALFSARLAARIGFRATILTGSVLFALAGVWPLIAPDNLPRYPVVLLSLLLWGASNGIIQPALFATASTAPASDLSSASAVLTMSRQLGSAVGVALLVAVVGASTPPGGVDARAGWVLVIASAVVVAVAATWRRPRSGEQGTRPPLGPAATVRTPGDRR